MSVPSQSLPQAQAQTQPSPVLFFETINGYQRTQALKSAIELDLFTAIGEGNTTPEAIALRCQASVRGTRILCDYLVVAGFLKKENGGYGLTPDSAAFLNRHSPAYLGGTLQFLVNPMLLDTWNDIAAVVRKGGTVISPAGAMEAEHPMWADFARGMAPLMKMPAEIIARILHANSAPKWKVLDIAAGHGIFGITLAQHNRQAEIVAVDWKHVLEVAQENARQAGVQDRYRTLAGSAFEVDFGGGYEVVLLTNFLHHFDPPTNEVLLRKVHAALAPGGRAVALEFVPNEDRVSPGPAAQFSLTMLAGTAAGDAYTFAEYQQMLANAGFAESELHEMPPTFERLVVAKKK